MSNFSFAFNAQISINTDTYEISPLYLVPKTNDDISSANLTRVVTPVCQSDEF